MPPERRAGADVSRLVLPQDVPHHCTWCRRSYDATTKCRQCKRRYCFWCYEMHMPMHDPTRPWPRREDHMDGPDREKGVEPGAAQDKEPDGRCPTEAGDQEENAEGEGKPCTRAKCNRNKAACRQRHPVETISTSSGRSRSSTSGARSNSRWRPGDEEGIRKNEKEEKKRRKRGGRLRSVSRSRTPRAASKEPYAGGEAGETPDIEADP